MNCCRETVEMTCHQATAGGWTRGVLEQYVAGSDTRGRPGGQSYYSRSLRSAQSRKRVPSFGVAEGHS